MKSTTYDIDENGNENRILFWLRLDFWEMKDAALLFVDVDPDSAIYKNGALIFSKFKTLRGGVYDLSIESPTYNRRAHKRGENIESLENIDQMNAEINTYESKYNDIYRWLYNPDTSLDTPKNWIKRALAKKINIPWLEFAIEQGFYEEVRINLENEQMRINDGVNGDVTPSMTQTNKVQTIIFDKTSPTYPLELDLAFQAWHAVANNEGKGKPKARIKNWLNENTTLSEEAKNRIATVANWDKLGGATRTN